MWSMFPKRICSIGHYNKLFVSLFIIFYVENKINSALIGCPKSVDCKLISIHEYIYSLRWISFQMTLRALILDKNKTKAI